MSGLAVGYDCTKKSLPLTCCCYSLLLLAAPPASPPPAPALASPPALPPAASVASFCTRTHLYVESNEKSNIWRIVRQAEFFTEQLKQAGIVEMLSMKQTIYQ